MPEKHLPAVPSDPIRSLDTALGSVLDTIEAPGEWVKEGFANLTNGIARALPSFPAATLGSLAIAIPHAHLHPPSCIPPAPPIPLPVIGAMAIGCCPTVLIHGLPAARAGDIGISPTCCGFFPFFESFLGSSKVYFGGARAARATDVTMHCWPDPTFLVAGKLAKIAKVATKVMDGVDKAGMVSEALGIAVHVEDAAAAAASDAAGSAALAEGHALAAVTGALQMASDAVSAVFNKMLGRDPGIGIPAGALVDGHGDVLVGGFPMPASIVERLLGSLDSHKPNKHSTSDPASNPHREQGPCGCP